MLALLALWLAATRQGAVLRGVWQVFRANPLFWTVTGSVGFGVFYAPLCYSAGQVPGWVAAATWQSTILATPLVLLFFGRQVPTRGLVFTGLIFLGIVLVNAEQAPPDATLSGGPARRAARVPGRTGLSPGQPAGLGGAARRAPLRAARGPSGAGQQPGPGAAPVPGLPFWAGLLLVTRPARPRPGRWPRPPWWPCWPGWWPRESSCTRPQPGARPPTSWPRWTPPRPWRCVFAPGRDGCSGRSGSRSHGLGRGGALGDLGLALYVLRQASGR